jgi:V/A-type H+-transporting ATPase subunit A
MLKDYFLLQNAFHPVDAYCPIEKTYKMLGTLLRFYEKTKSAIEVGVPLTKILSLPVREGLGRLKLIAMDEFDAVNTRINKEIDEQFDQLTSVPKDGGEVE